MGIAYQQIIITYLHFPDAIIEIETDVQIITTEAISTMMRTSSQSLALPDCLRF